MHIHTNSHIYQACKNQYSLPLAFISLIFLGLSVTEGMIFTSYLRINPLGIADIALGTAGASLRCALSSY